ncbi:hypothetical protein [Yersinia phage vB_Yru_GN1]|uniref:Uncharacterized protein n=1 Tax=Yersinia phage vB_Yru_GN1 TaxID=3074381 RepID=A0AA86JCN1_9CAUD|nr:hypothetical protein [Yersinia phage vB_Yru_GN1]
MIGLKLINHRVDKVGRNISTYLNPLNNKPTNVRMLIRYLKSINSSRTELILKLNDLSIDDLPTCKYCKINKVSLNLSDISNPELHDRCSDSKCIKKSGISRGIRLRYKNGNGPGQQVSKESRLIRAQNAQITRKINGTQGFQHLSPERRSNIIRNIIKSGYANGNMWYQNSEKLHHARIITNKTALLNGTHNSQSGKNNPNKCIKLNYNGRIISFKSNIEHLIFIRFKRLLSKYYNREK